MLGTDTSGETVGATESDVARLDTTGHVMGLGGRVDDLVNGLHGEVEGHELADGVEASEGGTDGETAETRLGDRRVNDTLVAEAVEQAFGDLVAVEGVLSACFLLHTICAPHMRSARKAFGREHNIPALSLQAIRNDSAAAMHVHG